MHYRQTTFHFQRLGELSQRRPFGMHYRSWCLRLLLQKYLEQAAARCVNGGLKTMRRRRSMTAAYAAGRRPVSRPKRVEALVRPQHELRRKVQRRQHSLKRKRLLARVDAVGFAAVRHRTWAGARSPRYSRSSMHASMQHAHGWAASAERGPHRRSRGPSIAPAATAAAASTSAPRAPREKAGLASLSSGSGLCLKDLVPAEYSATIWPSPG